jgi:hypothetical protein
MSFKMDILNHLAKIKEDPDAIDSFLYKNDVAVLHQTEVADMQAITFKRNELRIDMSDELYAPKMYNPLFYNLVELWAKQHGAKWIYHAIYGDLWKIKS